MDTNNVIMEGLNEEFVDRVRSKYANRFNTISKHVSGFNEEKALKLGILLENTGSRLSRYQSLFESTQTANVLDKVKTQYFDIISATYPNLIAEELFSVQPLRYKSGEIFYLDTVYGSNKGVVRKGDPIFTQKTITGYENRNYSSEFIDQEIIGNGDGSTAVYDGNLSYVPVEAGTIVINAGGVSVKDDGNGNFVGAGIKGGTIDYNTGKFHIEFTAAPTDNVDAQYNYANEFAPIAVPEVDIEVKSYLIQARSKKLRGRYSLDAAYDLRQAQGIDLSDVLKSNSAQLLRHETDGMLISDAYHQAANAVTFTDAYNGSKNPGISKLEYYLEFISKITEGSGMIRQATKRVEGNWIVCGNKATNILNFIGAPRFVKADNFSVVGPHFAGMLDGRYRVYVDPFLGEDEFLIGYKGDNMLDAGLVYAPYLPFYCTDAVALDDFLGRQGFSTSYGKKMVNSNYYVRGKIVNG